MGDFATELASTVDDRIDEAEAAVRAYCRWHITPVRQDTCTFRRPSSRVLMLPSLHVVSVDSIVTDGVLVDPATYVWTEAGVVAADWPCWGVSTTVTFTHGYAQPPAELVGVVRAMAQRSVDNPNGMALSSITRGPFAESYDTTGRDTEQSLLDRYKLPPRF